MMKKEAIKQAINLKVGSNYSSWTIEMCKN